MRSSSFPAEGTCPVNLGRITSFRADDGPAHGRTGTLRCSPVVLYSLLYAVVRLLPTSPRPDRVAARRRKFRFPLSGATNLAWSPMPNT
jgi:hypothetical protein